MEDENVGMIGYTKFDVIEYLSKDSSCYKFLGEYLNYFECEISDNSEFVPGRIFWIKDSILRKFLTQSKLIRIYETFNPKYINNQLNFDGKIQAFERLFGIFIKSQYKDIICINHITS